MKFLGTLLFSMAMLLAGTDDGCDNPTPKSASGVAQQTAQVQVGNDGLTVEQRNVKDRLAMDNKPGSIKHLYVISAYSGQVILYSTVKGKVTSSGKRLTPTTVVQREGFGFTVPALSSQADGRQMTNEVLQDDGTYGSSVEYLYWWDVQGRYHQHYVSGGQIVHISDQPISAKSIVINFEAVKE